MKTVVLMTVTLLFSVTQVEAQDVQIPQIGVEAPSFTAMSTNGKINFPADFGDHWKVVLSHPKDFTPVCSSELLELAHAQESFAELNAKLLVVSTDIMEQHESWKKALERVNYKERSPVRIEFPLVADDDLKVSKKYGMIHSQTSVKENIRGVYYIDPDNIVRAIQFYPIEVGRNVEEIQRALVALQTVDRKPNRATPANWQAGEDLLVPVLSQEEKERIDRPGSPLYQYSWFLVFEKYR